SEAARRVRAGCVRAVPDPLSRCLSIRRDDRSPCHASQSLRTSRRKFRSAKNLSVCNHYCPPRREARQTGRRGSCRSRGALRRVNAALLLLSILLWASGASAQESGTPAGKAKPAASDSQPGASSKAAPEKGPASQGDNTGESTSGNKTGNMLADSGIKLELQEQSEVWANLVGGGKRGTSYNGLTTATLDVDLEKAVGWQ